MKEQEDRLSQLKQEHEALKVALEAKAKEITEAESSISLFSGALNTQREVAATALDTAERAVAIVPGDIGSDDDDLYTLAEIDCIRLSALWAVRGLLNSPM